MTDDLLKRASAALREETAAADEGARFTRARVLASLQQSQVRRRSRLAVLLPLAACFAAASAFGMVNGQVPAFVRSVSRTLGLAEEPAPPPPPARSKPPAAPPTTPTPTPTAALAPLEAPPLTAPAESPASIEGPTAAANAQTPALKPDPPARPRERVAPPAASAAAPSEARRSAEPPAPATAELGDVSDRAHELYRVAHRTHFVDHDFVSALRAWDAYLEAASNGRFVLEARYNRALCLVRLGRKSEARDALTPFASGKFAGYRRDEARALIEALGN